MKFNLMPYQQALVAEFTSHAGRILFHVDVGLGKTRTSLACAYVAAAERILYVCPASIKEQVKEEAVKCEWKVYETDVITGDTKKRHKQWSDMMSGYPEHQLTIVNYELLNNDIKIIKEWNPDMIIIDECQRMGASTNKIHKVLKQLSPAFRIAMSGTPAPNALYEFYPILSWVRPEVYGTNFYRWRSLNCYMHPVIPGKIIGYYDQRKIRENFSLYTLRLKRDNVLKLPPMGHVTERIEISKQERERYKKLKETLAIEMNGEEVTVPNLLALMLRLRQVIDTPQLFGETAPSSKQVAFKELVDKIFAGGLKKIIVFVVHKTAADELAKLYGGEVYDGSLSEKKRSDVLGAFKTATTNSILYMTAAGQTGLNITEAKCIIHYQLPYTFAAMEQREGRIWRMGQTDGCVAYTILAQGTVDINVKQIVEGKREITRDDLLEMFK